jgi:hypothetical protein
MEKSSNNAPQPVLADPSQKQEIKDIHERLKTIIRTVSGKYDLEVTTDMDPQTRLSMLAEGKDPDSEWFREIRLDPITKKPKGEYVHIPPSIFEKTENIAKGSAAHEAGHVLISRYGDFIPEDVIQQLGFHSIMASAEERPTDHVVRQRFHGAGEWVDEMRSGMVEDFDADLGKRNNLGYLPKLAQLCNLLVFSRHMKDIPSVYESDVLEVFRKIETHVKDIEECLPHETASEEEVVKLNKKRYQITYTKLWPEIKKLLKQDQNTEELRQMIKEILQQQQGAGSEKGQGDAKENGPFDDLPDELKKELGDLAKEVQKELEKGKAGSGSAIENTEERDGSSDSEQAQGVGDSEDSNNTPEDAKDGGQKSGEDDPVKSGTASGGDSTEEKKGETDEVEGFPDDGEGNEIPIPMNKIGEKLKKALQEAFDKLPEEIKEKLKEKATKTLKDIEDEIVKKTEGELMMDKPETHKERETRLAQEKNEEQKRERQKQKEDKEKEEVRKEMEAVEKKLAVLRENSSVYEQAYQKMRVYDEELYQRLEDLFTPNIKRSVRLRSSGSRLNLPALFRWEASRSAGVAAIDNKIFETVHLPQKMDYIISILVDLSGSMEGENIRETFKAVVLLAEVLNRLGVKNEIIGFQDRPFSFKEFGVSLNDEVRRKISGMIDEASGMNPGGNNNTSTTNLGSAVLSVSADLNHESAKQKFLIVLTDGQPSDPEVLETSMKDILKDNEIKTVALGLGPDTEMVVDYFPTSVPNIRAQDLPNVLGSLLEDIIKNPENYSVKG